MITLHVLIEGRVQGVFFRDSTRRRARELGLHGWVRNLPDGRVEAVFQGDDNLCAEALSYVKEGPRGARVTRVEHRWMTESELFEDFEVRW